MAREPSVKQVWQCMTCESEYRSPIVVAEVLCPSKHPGRGNPRQMKLIEEPVNNAS